MTTVVSFLSKFRDSSYKKSGLQLNCITLGGMGFSIVHELAERGIQVLAFTRNREKLERLFVNQKNIQIVTGDALMDSGVFNTLSVYLYMSRKK
ncbi:MAG TPA: NAD(P)-binding domain-containing protein [Bacillota bacterium]|nr:NAD(P)-binding domain-containing protein [Bacillota bacterium]